MSDPRDGLTYPLLPRDAERPSVPSVSQAGFWPHYFIGLVVFLFAIMALETFVGDAFVIRTSSMEPTIVGRPADGDQVVLDRIAYRLRDPRRFEIVLFTYPNNRLVNYMKRLVGLPEERLFIQGGDLYRAALHVSDTLRSGVSKGTITIVRKPDSVQDALFERFPVLFPDELAPWGLARFQRHFQIPAEDTQRWRDAEGGVTLDASERTALARTRREPKDVIFDRLLPATPDGPPAAIGPGGRHAVGDLSLRVQVRPISESGWVVLRIYDPAHERSLEARVGVGSVDASSELVCEGVVLGRSRTGLARQRPTTLRFDNVDDRLSLWFDGELVLRRDYSHPPAEIDERLRPGRGGAAFGAENAQVFFGEPRLYRDLYYVQDGVTEFAVPKDHFVFLGDNSASSSDSRIWKRSAVRVVATGEILEGDLQGVTVEGRTVIGKNPFVRADGRIEFVDRWGVSHGFDRSDELADMGSWPTPYVRREDLLGRGIVVSAPWSRWGRLR